MEKKISIIVPVYNGRVYIERCIKSIINQSNFNIDDLEIMLLNDGSTDDSLAILRKYKENYPTTIKLISHRNIGVAKTRNKGIQLAAGSYIMFVDQDDYIDEDFCKVLYEEIIAGDYDAVYSGMKRPDINGRIITRSTYGDTDFSKYMNMSIWAKIHKTSFLRKNNINLFDNPIGEDVAFTFEEYQKSKKIRSIQYCGYNWFYNASSVSNTSQRRLDEGNTVALVNLQNKLISLNRRNEEMGTFFIIMITAYYIFFAGRSSSPKQFMDAVDALMNNLESKYPRYAKNLYLKTAPKGILPVFSIGLKIFMTLYKLKALRVFAYIYCRDKDNGQAA